MAVKTGSGHSREHLNGFFWPKAEWQLPSAIARLAGSSGRCHIRLVATLPR